MALVSPDFRSKLPRATSSRSAAISEPRTSHAATLGCGGGSMGKSAADARFRQHGNGYSKVIASREAPRHGRSTRSIWRSRSALKISTSVCCIPATEADGSTHSTLRLMVFPTPTLRSSTSLSNPIRHEASRPAVTDTTSRSTSGIGQGDYVGPYPPTISGPAPAFYHGPSKIRE